MTPSYLYSNKKAERFVALCFTLNDGYFRFSLQWQYIFVLLANPSLAPLSEQ